MTNHAHARWLSRMDLSSPPSATGGPDDPDPQETAEWMEAFDALVEQHGPERARWMLSRLAERAGERQVGWRPPLNTPYVNTVPVERQPVFPGDLGLEERLGSIIRWNALAMVVRANRAHGELGGHIASYASAADLFEVGFNHFFRARTDGFGGDLVFFQPHSAPGVYARAYLEGRLPESALAHYRRELAGAAAGTRGLSSYPHPWLMPDFWQFPTGSMGLGPISAIHQARFLRYLQDRGLLPAQPPGPLARKTWGFFGDGEMDEPESMSALTLAAREKLDDLVFVINCNLQRLDGPVRGNGRIIDELEALFSGAGWNVIKLVWGSDWDGLFARDADGALIEAFAHTPDGQFQTFAAHDGRYNRERFFGQNPALARLAQGLTDEQIDRLRRGGHDLVKIHAAYQAAADHRGQPTVILAHTKKGFGMGEAGQGRMTTHQQKKLERDALVAFRNRFSLPLTDDQAESLEFLKPADDAPEMRYLHARRAALGGFLPHRLTDAPRLPVPPREQWAAFARQQPEREMSTTMAFVRMLTALLKDAALGARIVPIVADEARTFGMANLFRQVGIYSSAGQCYEPEDIGSVLYYREARDGQILEEGITEAGALASWTAAATSYSVHGLPMLPFYIYYSMFGFQRVGDAIWAAADQRPRGFLIGATSGRTTLAGEGLQHQDGTSQLVAATVPNCRAYDPAFADELAVIVEAGMREMLEEQRDVFYYVTVGNESYAQRVPAVESREGILRGMHRIGGAEPAADAPRVQLLASGSIVGEALRAADLLATECGVAADVWSVTSFSELAREGMAAERDAWAGRAPATTWLAARLGATQGPIVAASDWVRAVPEQLRAHLPPGRRYVVLGTDGFGRSDTRAALRDFFEIDARWIAQAALSALARDGAIDAAVPTQAAARWALEPDPAPPWTR